MKILFFLLYIKEKIADRIRWGKVKSSKNVIYCSWGIISFLIIFDVSGPVCLKTILPLLLVKKVSGKPITPNPNPISPFSSTPIK